MSRESGRYCGRCDEPIRQGEDTETHAVFSASGAGGSVIVHKHCPVTPRPGQTFPARRS